MKKTNEQGFTLIEIIIVLGLIGTLAIVILPNLTLTVDSQMSSALRNVTAQIRNAYDDAIFSGRLNRMIFDIKSGEYWVEQAPLGFEGRPPLPDTDSEIDSLAKQDKKKQLLKSFDEKAKNSASREMTGSTSTNPKYYSSRSIPVVQRKILRPLAWREINDSVTYRQKLPGNIVFAQISSMVSLKKYDYVEVLSSQDKTKKVYAYIYFLPNGTATPASVKLGTTQSNNKNALDDEGPRYTINLNTLTGESHLLEGFQDANFTIPKK
ncbi:prepilin-type N-terminal cleavage/methylation domain-containing protein [Silvanigrella aquatica]|uniref:Type II secretion system protein GspH n=1 Tax=Silvanigrella aquatica TaxID=1915309 RepID=A0A1L4CZ92_9BACT|nr:type II secretion system protein [Silvanigrella aquatica]APJ03274.1 hypothetical protein AXG55_04900 [Silvanigrella aquatica]